MLLPGEQPLDVLQFKSSHNSYERSQPNDRLVAEYNCWALEFDLNWDGSESGNYGRGVWVAHECATEDTKSLRTELRDTMRAAFFTSRVTLIDLDMKDHPHCPDWDAWPVNAVDLVKERVDDALSDVGLSFLNVYTPDDFRNDGSRWPAWQELVRRDKHLLIALFTKDLNLNGAEINPWFFNALSNPDSWNSDQYNYAFVNRERGSTNGISISPFAIDRWMWRSWPTSDEGDNWQTAVDRGFNVIGTDNVDQVYTNDGADVHSSQPLFVNWLAMLPQWGTYHRPYRTLTTAYNRASPGVDVHIASGTYNEQLTLAKPMHLHARGGSVRIGPP